MNGDAQMQLASKFPVRGDPVEEEEPQLEIR